MYLKTFERFLATETALRRRARQFPLFELKKVETFSAAWPCPRTSLIPKGTIIIMKHSIFMDKINYCICKIILHWQIHFHMGKTMFAWATSLLHWQIYYCMGKSIIAWANLLLHWQIYLAWAIYFVWAKSFCVCNEGLVPNSFRWATSVLYDLSERFPWLTERYKVPRSGTGLSMQFQRTCNLLYQFSCA